MKCQEAEKLLLLQDSGEMPPNQANALATHLHNCNACREFQHAMIESQGYFRTKAEPSAKALQDVLREARLNAPKKKSPTLSVWKPALAMAASIVVVFGILMAPGGNKVGMELVVTETQLLEAEDQAVSVMYEGLSEDDLAFNFLMTYEDSYASL